MYSDAPDDLPVRPVVPAVLAALRATGAAVLVAPPGSGKTTLVPLAVAEEVTGRVLVAQPRRMAARAAARRMAALLGERVGERVGYAVRGDRRVGPRTRIEVVTTGLLVRRLHRDPELTGSDAVLLDEIHERQLDADLALAFTVEARAALRPELWLLGMSATPDSDRVAALLGGDAPAPVVRASAAAHPVTRIWAPPPRPVVPAGGGRVDPALLDHVAATIRRALREHDDDVLVFLPGTGEIAAVSNRLAGLPAEIAVLPLHGRQRPAEQDAVLRAQPFRLGESDARPRAGSDRDRRRVVLATSVAESSLTVPGVRVVVDSGLARVARTDLVRGLGALVTVAVSRAAATQRAGRAGREGPGQVYRCWSAAHHERLAAQPEPEIATADLTRFALDLAAWGAPDGRGLALPDPPPPAAFAVARDSLLAIGALDADGRVTSRGRAIAAVGTHPRLGRALIDGAARIGPDRAAEVVALLAEEGVAGPRDDLTVALRRLRSGTDAATTNRWRAEVRRLRTALPPGPGPTTPERSLPDDLAVGLVVGLAYPERLARIRRPDDRTYLMSGGTAATLAPGSTLIDSVWLAVAVADRTPGAPAARIRLAAPIDEATARAAGGALLTTVREVAWSGTDVVAREVVRLGSLDLVERPLADPDQDQLCNALVDGLRRTGLGLLTWSPAARALRERLAFCHTALGDRWPDVGDEALLATATDWLAPELAGARRRADLTRIDVLSALRRLLPWPAAARLDELAPERLTVPSGSRIRVDYTDPTTPVLAVRLQETFGWPEAPRIAGGRVPVLLRLLSPAGRPVAVTGDLASFWRSGYPQVRAELRGRYPRHSWPVDPTTAEPTRRANPRRR
ncbi:ATP-dependent helicase HrpB [Salinispora tropica]|uniref:ATP-dependent helicase HrpB n=1 Tax=Salinispora tropica (strain ATCC BAA-916 / DSM 44818 / JCM 13857 / NBRC 105044 / CNB-440) TaxID=369723 RepID=A4X5Q7_SALTO|nr:ATP-dependent helicase HrpB [Salinispora tropica]ABP54207.1 ATP-dependent helicase HrpB [Salinispora tropica CNB-440]